MIKILVTGDFCPINSTEKYSLEGEHDKIFNNFLPVLQRADFRITNLECPLFDGSVSAEKFGPVLKASPQTAASLSFAQIDLVTMANNHIMDQGTPGLHSTIEALNQKNISYVGVGNDLNEARRPHIRMINGKKIAVFNFAENEFSNTHGDAPGANPLSLASNFNDIRKYRDEADYILAIVHGGNETFELPSPRFKETLRFYADCGADAVIAHHTHCVSGYEVYNGVPVFYGIGNFVFDYHTRKPGTWTTGIAVELSVGDDVSFNIIPFHQNLGDTDGVTLMNESEKQVFMQHLDNLNEIIADDAALAAAFNAFIETKKKQYSHFLEPYSNKILHGLFGRKLIPSFYTKEKKRLLLNLIRCESHRDVILNLLSR